MACHLSGQTSRRRARSTATPPRFRRCRGGLVLRPRASRPARARLPRSCPPDRGFHRRGRGPRQRCRRTPPAHPSCSSGRSSTQRVAHQRGVIADVGAESAELETVRTRHGRVVELDATSRRRRRRRSPRRRRRSRRWRRSPEHGDDDSDGGDDRRHPRRRGRSAAPAVAEAPIRATPVDPGGLGRLGGPTPAEPGRGRRRGAVGALTVLGPLRPALTSASVDASTRASRLVSLSKRLGLSSSAWRRTSPARLSGSSSARGIRAPSTRTGMRRTLRASAASTSRRTKSWGSSSRRRPRSSVIVNHLSPIKASNTSHDPTAVVIAATKSSPKGIESTSLKTCASPNRSSRRSYSHPAGYAVSFVGS